MFEVGWTSHMRASDPILWHWREHNQIADFIVNYTMDTARDWFYEYLEETAELDVQSCNLVCHSDGGTRGESCSAAAWFLEAVYVRSGLKYTVPVAMGGKYLSQAVSSFFSETIALDEALEFTSSLILNRSSRAT